jgi:hypothetical protein
MLIRRVLFVGALVPAAAACGALFPDPWPTTIVRNESSTPLVVRADGEGSTPPLYYAVPPGGEVVVDTVGHVNPATEEIVLLTSDCEAISEVAGNFWEGGVITVGAALDASFEPGHQTRHGDDGEDTCERAASQLGG